MPPTDDRLDWKGRVVVDLHGHHIGRIVDVQFKSETHVPQWGVSPLAGSVFGGASFHSAMPNRW